MIKRYNQFVNENSPAIKPVETPTETPTETPKPVRPSVVPTERPSEEDNPLAYGDMNVDAGNGNEIEVEGGLQGLASILDVEVEKNIIHYDGHEIDMPSETEKFRVDGIDLKTNDPEKVVAYLNNPEAQAEAQAKKDRRAQAQAQRRAQAQGEFEKGPDKTETELDPEAQALKAQAVDIEDIEESKSYKSKYFRRRF
jgi:hypothetical protein